MKKGSGTILLLFIINISMAQSFQIGSLKIVPKKDFEYNSLIKVANDTLEIATCAKYVIFPFGEISNINQLKSTLLKDFKILSHKTEDSIYHYYELTLNSNTLTLVIDTDFYASAHSNILKGIIINKTVKTANNIFIGMPIKSFYNLFFRDYPMTLCRKFRIIIFDYCVDGIKHIYTFNDDQLFKIEYQ